MVRVGETWERPDLHGAGPTGEWKQYVVCAILAPSLTAERETISAARTGTAFLRESRELPPALRDLPVLVPTEPRGEDAAPALRVDKFGPVMAYESYDREVPVESLLGGDGGWRRRECGE